MFEGTHTFTIHCLVSGDRPLLLPLAPCPPGCPTSPTLALPFKFQDLIEVESIDETFVKAGEEARVSVCKTPGLTIGSALPTNLEWIGLCYAWSILSWEEFLGPSGPKKLFGHLMISCQLTYSI